MCYNYYMKFGGDIMTKEVVAIIVLSVINLVLIIALIVLISVTVNVMKKMKKEKNIAYCKLANAHIDILFLGDSLTEFYHLSDYFYDFDIANRGVAGDTVSGVKSRLESQVYPLQPKKIFLMIGTNDLGLKIKVNEIIQGIIEIINEIKINLPSTKIYLWSIPPVNIRATKASVLTVGFRTNNDIDEINEGIKQYAKENNIVYIDINTCLKNEKGVLDPKYTLEGLHLSEQAYIKITEKLLPYLKK